MDWYVLQRVPAGGEAWSVLQRTGAVGRNGAKLLGVGFFASLCGVTITNLLLEVSTQKVACVCDAWQYNRDGRAVYY